MTTVFDVRPLLHGLVYDTMDATPADADAIFPLPVDHGFVAVFLDGRTPMVGTKHEPTALRLSEVEACCDLIAAEGLGATAAVCWDAEDHNVAAFAWGATSQAAVRMAGLMIEASWPRPTAVEAASRAIDGLWRSGEQRRVPGTGVTITAPIPDASHPSANLYWGDGSFSVQVRVDGDAHDWRAAVERVLALVPAGLGERLLGEHRDLGAEPQVAWDTVVGDLPAEVYVWPVSGSALELAVAA